MAFRRMVVTAVAVLGAVALSACGDSGGGGGGGADQSTAPVPTTATSGATTAPGAAGITDPPVDAEGEPPRLRAVALTGFDAPLALAVRPGDQALYVAEKGGRVKALRGGRTVTVLDLSGQVSTGGEQGLLGLAFSPDGDRLYVNFTNREGNTRVVEYAFRDSRADTASRREILAVDQPFANHNGGHLLFGPDGMLYIGLGDGGGAGDPENNGQRLDTLLGKILRIDPRPSGTGPYTVPPDNPFVGRSGTRPEIWAYGLRNPWRFSFDRETGALWIADVGQGSREEVNAADSASKGGENYGWNRFEGTERLSGAVPPDNVAPVHDYSRAGGNCAVTGGYVYRGDRIAGLRGRYVFADYCRGEVLALVPDGQKLRSVSLGPRVEALASFGEDGAGELYLMSLVDGVFRLEPA